MNTGLNHSGELIRAKSQSPVFAYIDTMICTDNSPDHEAPYIYATLDARADGNKSDCLRWNASDIILSRGCCSALLFLYRKMDRESKGPCQRNASHDEPLAVCFNPSAGRDRYSQHRNNNPTASIRRNDSRWPSPFASFFTVKANDI